MLHKKAIEYVKAASQAYIARNILDILSEEEEGILKRGRNQKSGTVPKNANVGDYKWATGLEALIGYLTLKGEKERVQELIQKGIVMIESRDKVD